MFCGQCGTKATQGASFCIGCGSKLHTESLQPAQPVQQAVHQAAPATPPAPEPLQESVATDSDAVFHDFPTMSFGDAISASIKGAFVTDGRASRAEFWWGHLAVLLACIFLFLIDVGLNLTESTPIVILTTIANLVCTFVIVGILMGLVFRRLHDHNRSGWWQLIFLTGIGGFILLYWYLTKGTPGKNDFGAHPHVAKRSTKRSAGLIAFALIYSGVFFVIEVLTKFDYWPEIAAELGLPDETETATEAEDSVATEEPSAATVSDPWKQETYEEYGVQPGNEAIFDACVESNINAHKAYRMANGMDDTVKYDVIQEIYSSCSGN